MSKYIGYARVACDGPGLQVQQEALELFGCERVFAEVVSGISSITERTELSAALDGLVEGDTLVIANPTRLGRSMPLIVTLLQELDRRGVSVWSLDRMQTIDLNPPRLV